MRLRSAIKQLKNRVAPANPPKYSFDIPTWSRLSKTLKPEDRAWLLDGIEDGFDIQVNESPDLARDRVKNLPADALQQLRITEWIIKNVDKKAIWGPFNPKSNSLPAILDNYRVSPIGCVRKGIHFDVPDEDKEWRTIHHLSHPRQGISVNSEVKDEWSTVSYVSFMAVVRMVHSLGPGAYLWTVDAKDAYLRVPIKDQCMRFMCFIWSGMLFAFTSLSFGLTSAPRIYTLFADHVLHIAKESYPGIWANGNQSWVYHYIDDFFGGAPAGWYQTAQVQFQVVIRTFEILGIPTKPPKCCGPATRMKILGFIYDTVRQMLFIPEPKKQQMLFEIDRCLDPRNRRVKRSDVQSLIGKLRWFSNCLWAGPAFVRRLEEEVNRKVNGYHPAWIKTSRLRLDLLWWRQAIFDSKDGVRFVDLLRDRADGDVHVRTDASTKDGMGGWSRDGHWFRYQWNSFRTKHIFRDPRVPDIYWKEMCAIVTACELWGPSWNGKAVTFWCDNEACVFSVAKRRCSFDRPDVMALIRIIAEMANKFNFRPYILHIKGKDNLTADALSRFDLRKFHEDTAGIEMAEVATRSECEISDFVVSLVDRCDLKRLVDGSRWTNCDL